VTLVKRSSSDGISWSDKGEGGISKKFYFGLEDLWYVLILEFESLFITL